MKTIPWTEIPEDTSGGPLATEWNFYRREVGRLLAEGHEGKWLLIKGEEIVGIWATRDEAFAEQTARYPRVPSLVRQILAAEPLLRLSLRVYRTYVAGATVCSNVAGVTGCEPDPETAIARPSRWGGR